jgi:hypothetical protein
MNKPSNISSPSSKNSPGTGSGTAEVQRIASIDILRALTMMLMIFVNDFWTLKGVPYWMEHRKHGVDGIGLSDVVFPAFLFIVGLSLPYAINNRRNKGDSDWQMVKHILLRTIALLVMGVFLVNGETYNTEATGLAKYHYSTLCCLSFILIWNTYPTVINKYIPLAARAVAIFILITISIIYTCLAVPLQCIHHTGFSLNILDCRRVRQVKMVRDYKTGRNRHNTLLPGALFCIFDTADFFYTSAGSNGYRRTRIGEIFPVCLVLHIYNRSADKTGNQDETLKIHGMI